MSAFTFIPTSEPRDLEALIGLTIDHDEVIENDLDDGFRIFNPDVENEYEEDPGEPWGSCDFCERIIRPDAFESPIHV